MVQDSYQKSLFQKLILNNKTPNIELNIAPQLLRKIDLDKESLLSTNLPVISKINQYLYMEKEQMFVSGFMLEITVRPY